MTLVQQLVLSWITFSIPLKTKQNKTKQKSPWTGLCCLLSHHARCISFLLLIISWSFSSINWLHSLTIHSCTFSTCSLTSALTVLLHVLSQIISEIQILNAGALSLTFPNFCAPFDMIPRCPLTPWTVMPCFRSTLAHFSLWSSPSSYIWTLPSAWSSAFFILPQ